MKEIPEFLMKGSNLRLDPKRVIVHDKRSIENIDIEEKITYIGSSDILIEAINVLGKEWFCPYYISIEKDGLATFEILHTITEVPDKSWVITDGYTDILWIKEFINSIDYTSSNEVYIVDANSNQWVLKSKQELDKLLSTVNYKHPIEVPVNIGYYHTAEQIIVIERLTSRFPNCI
jgi:hypothetical protein